jgi:hypothetical protein
MGLIRAPRARMMRAVRAARLLVSFACLAGACGGDESQSSSALADAGAADGACTVEIAAHEVLTSPHIARSAYSDAVYNSNPPSSGPHCDSWGAWRAYERPLPRCNWIHNLEHGGVVVTWNCARECPEVAGTLVGIARAAADVCAPARVIVTPDLAAPTQVAAAAWGWTFRASCLDEAARVALHRFVSARLGYGPEQICAGGSAAP